MTSAYEAQIQAFHAAKSLGSLGRSTPAPAPAREVTPSAQEQYSPSRMIDLLIEHPEWQHKQVASYFGKGMGWFCGVIASDAFQDALDPRRHEISDPMITATLEERFRALTVQGLQVMQVALSKESVDPYIAAEALKISTKALGMGNPKSVDKPLTPEANSLDTLAERLTSLMATRNKPQLQSQRDAIIDVEVSSGS